MIEEIVKEFIEMFPDLEEKVKTIINFQTPTVSFPVWLDGVIDEVVFDVEKKEFVELRLTMAKPTKNKDGGMIQADWTGKNTVYAEAFEMFPIKIDRTMPNNEIRFIDPDGNVVGKIKNLGE